MFLIDDLLIIGGSALLGGLIGGAAGAAIGFIIDVFLDESSIGSEVKVRYPDALKILIQEKKKTMPQEHKLSKNIEVNKTKMSTLRKRFIKSRKA